MCGVPLVDVMHDDHTQVGMAARRAVNCLALLILRDGAISEAASLLQVREQWLEAAFRPLLPGLVCVVLAAWQHLAVVPRSECMHHLPC
jgi:hypothetical protein